MENKLSKGGSLRIKSPQLYHPATPVTTGTSGTALHTGAGDRSENGSAGRAVRGPYGPAVLCTCGHPRASHLTGIGCTKNGQRIGGAQTLCPCTAFKARGGVEAGKAARS